MIFNHHFEKGQHSPLTLLLLHGTGGNEHDLIPLGKKLAAKANLLGVRGKVLENGAPRFFRRLAPGVFDQHDLRMRTHELSQYLVEAADELGFPLGGLVAVGYSNGANMATSLMISRPKLLAGCLLYRGMIPFIPEVIPDLRGKPIFLSSGELDTVVEPDSPDRLAQLFQKCGATVERQSQHAGHELTAQDIEQGRDWLERNHFVEKE